MACRKFPALRNDRILKAARGEKTDCTPVWVMRQAGRYLPEFRELRKSHDFFEICKTPELACEVTLQPVRRFDVDAAIIFSDILVIPQSMGMHLEMQAGVGPVFRHPLGDLADFQDLRTKCSRMNFKEELSYVFEAITLTRHKLEGKVPLLGFCGAPWTLMGYMIEGGGTKTMSKAKRWLYQWPRESHDLLQLLTDITIDYLVEQVKAGAQMLQVFDSNAGYLGPKLYQEFSLPYIENIRHKVNHKLSLLGQDLVPMTIFAKDAHHSLEKIAETGYEVVGIDWTISPTKARACTRGATLQGNLDPCALYASITRIDEMVLEMIEEFGTHKYIANLGHGIYPDVNPDSMNEFVEAVHRHSQAINQGNLSIDH